MGRTLTFDIFRYNPQDPSSKPHMQSYQLPEHPRMNLFRIPPCSSTSAAAPVSAVPARW